MGMCKSCQIVFNANDMVNGYCKECIDSGKVSEDNLVVKNEKVLDFGWWTIWGWLSITLGNFGTYITFEREIALAIIFITINSILAIFILRFNKYAFLISTILTTNPLLWIINGIYLKNRWNHPKVNITNLKD